jgi:hypothetical protein
MEEGFGFALPAGNGEYRRAANQSIKRYAIDTDLVEQRRQ